MRRLHLDAWLTLALILAGTTLSAYFQGNGESEKRETGHTPTTTVQSPSPRVPVSPSPRQRAASKLPPDLERIRVDALDRLGRLYAVPVGRHLLPLEIAVAGSDGSPPPGWEGLPSYAAGAAQPRTGRIVLFPHKMGRYPFGDPAQTLRHELSHVMLYRSLGFRAPRWLDEGLAMRAASEWKGKDDLFVSLALFNAARGEYTLHDLEAEFAQGETRVRRAYALAKAFTRDLFETDAQVTSFLKDARAFRSTDAAFVKRFGVAPETAFRHWARDLPWWGEWFVWLGNPGTIWTAVIFLFIAAFFFSLRRRRRIYEELPD